LKCERDLRLVVTLRLVVRVVVYWVRSDGVGSGEDGMRLNEVMSDEVRSSWVSSTRKKIGSGQVRSSRVRSGEVGSVEYMSGRTCSCSIQDRT